MRAQETQAGVRSMSGGWTHAESPFHAGEQQVQERLGVKIG